MSEYKETGTITFIGKPESISNGQYAKLVFVITNNSGYEGAEKQFAFEIFQGTDGERIENFNKYNKVGNVVDVSFDIRTNENNGRWFTSLSAWKVFKAEGAAEVATSDAAPF